MSGARDQLLAGSGLVRLFRRRNRHKLLVLMYHGVVEEALEPFCWHQLPLNAFERQLAWLAEHYDVLPLDEALARRADGTLPERAAAITFDDGLRNNMTHAWPVLQRLDLPATIYLPTGMIGGGAALWPDRVHLLLATTETGSVTCAGAGLETAPLRTSAERSHAIRTALRVMKTLAPAARNEVEAELAGALATDPSPPPGPFRLMTWDEVAVMDADARMTFGAHTRTHPILAHAPDDDVTAEVSVSITDLAARVAKPSTSFAYPNGRAIDFDDRSRAAVEAAGIRYAFSTEQGLVGTDADDLALPRICIGSDLSFARFRLLASGAWQALGGH